MLTHKDLPVLAFTTPREFEAWLAQSHEQTTGIWLRLYKKGSGIETILIEQAVESAICWGWIDGLINRYDEVSYLIRFTQRRAKSVWSQVNVAKVERLIAEGRMQPSGLVHIEKAKEDGRWERAYAPASTMEVPIEFLDMLEQHPEEKEYFESLDRANWYAIAHRLATATNTKVLEARMEKVLGQLKRKEKIHNW